MVAALGDVRPIAAPQPIIYTCIPHLLEHIIGFLLKVKCFRNIVTDGSKDPRGSIKPPPPLLLVCPRVKRETAYTLLRRSNRNHVLECAAKYFLCTLKINFNDIDFISHLRVSLTVFWYEMCW